MRLYMTVVDVQKAFDEVKQAIVDTISNALKKRGVPANLIKLTKVFSLIINSKLTSGPYCICWGSSMISIHLT